MLWRTESYRLALFASDLAWKHVSALRRDYRTRDIANQLYRAVGSIGANIVEGFSRSSGRDRPRLYEFALGQLVKVGIGITGGGTCQATRSSANDWQS
ncbi:MAG: four helix bundle protein [Gemmatimonadaceae bacterium]